MYVNTLILIYHKVAICQIKRMKQKNRRIYIFLFIAVLVSTIALYFSKNEKQSKVLQPQQQNSMELSVIKVAHKPIELKFEFPARTSPYRTSDVRPQVSGIIVKKLFTEGSFVQKGEKLYQIDPVEKITILAPISGYIGRSFVTEGTLVTANQSTVLATITQLDPIYIDISIPSSEVLKIKEYQNTTIKLFINEEEYLHTGLLQFSEVLVNKNTDSVILRSIFKNPDNTLLTNMYVKVEIIIDDSEGIAIPQRTVFHLPSGEKYIWVVDQTGIISKRMITAKESVQNQWIVESGLHEGELVLYEGFQKIKEGAIIKPKIIELN